MQIEEANRSRLSLERMLTEANMCVCMMCLMPSAAVRREVLFLSGLDSASKPARRDHAVQLTELGPSGAK